MGGRQRRRNGVAWRSRGLTCAVVALSLLTVACPKKKKCEVDYTVVSQWQSGYVVEALVTNLQANAAFEGWALAFPMAANATLEDLWNGVLQSQADGWTIGNRPYNATIAPGQSVSFGFRVSSTEPAEIPATFRLNGNSCRVAGAATPTPAETPTPTPATPPTPTAPPPSAGIHVAFTKTVEWSTGYTAELVVTNGTSSSFSGWTLAFELEDTITQLWNGSVSSTGQDAWQVDNAPWNREIAPGGSVEFGFNANVATPPGSPGTCFFNGIPCSFEGSPPTGPTPSPSATHTPGATGTPGATASPTPSPAPTATPPGPTASPSPAPTSSPAPTPAGPSGEELYTLRGCAVCHGADGAGTAAAPSLLGWTDLAGLTAKIDVDMPLGNAAACTGSCATLVAAYILDELGNTPPPPIVCDTNTLRSQQLRLLTRREYAATVVDLLGLEATGALVNFPVEIRVRGYDNNAAVADVTARHIDEYLAEAEDLAVRAVAERRASLVPCDPNADTATCARTFVAEFGARAYRRPLSATEIDRLASFFSADPALFDVGLHDAIWAMLVSPHFLYRSEVGTLGSDGDYHLNPWEIASALSYLFWGTMPDDALFTAAADGTLSTPEGRRAQAERLLGDPRARGQLGRFASQWLAADPLLAGEKDQTAFPTFDALVQEAQFGELEAFLSYVAFDSTSTFAELFEPGYVMADPVLAAYYGLPIPSGAGFSPIPVADGSRGGLLTLGSVLSAQAHSDDGSPIRRGVFVRRRILCQDLPPPPPDVDNTPPGLDPSLTTRERFALHSESPTCQGCHQYIDGVGFGFEHFDGAGLRRESENGVPIDATGEIVGLEGLEQTSSVIPFDGTDDLSRWVGGSNAAPECLSLQLYRYAAGAEETAQDACEVDALTARFAASGYDLRELLLTVTELPSFTTRKGG